MTKRRTVAPSPVGAVADPAIGDDRNTDAAAGLGQSAVGTDRNARRRAYNGKADLPVLADGAAHGSGHELFPVAESLQTFHLAEIEGGDIRLTDTGKQFAELGMDDRKKLFQRKLLAYVPLAAHIRRILQERTNHDGAEKPIPGRAGRPH